MTTRAKWVLAGALTFGVGAVTWFVLAVLMPVSETAACANVEFRAGPEASPEDTARRPPVGGGGGLAGRFREALRGDTPAAFCNDFADPYVLRVDDLYYAYSTNTDAFNVPVLTSGGIFATGEYREALPELPEWTEPGFVWAPSVLPREDHYAMYYSTWVEHDRECISTAIADSPDGPFVDESTGPFICPDGGGAIDPDPFIASDGRAFLLWKEFGPDRDGIVAQELTPDGLSVTGPSELVVAVTEPWEGRLVESPTMVGYEGLLYLFYSANEWWSDAYAVGYALCDTPLGPCTKPAEEPWLASTEDAHGPGGQGIFDDEEGRLWMVVHAWVNDRIGYPDGARNLFVLRLHFEDGVPVAS